MFIDDGTGKFLNTDYVVSVDCPDDIEHSNEVYLEMHNGQVKVLTFESPEAAYNWFDVFIGYVNHDPNDPE